MGSSVDLAIGSLEPLDPSLEKINKNNLEGIMQKNIPLFGHQPASYLPYYELTTAIEDFDQEIPNDTWISQENKTWKFVAQSLQLKKKEGSYCKNNDFY